MATTTTEGANEVSAIEVILSWEGTALDSEVLARDSAAMRLVVGPGEGSRFLLPGEVVGERGFELIEREGVAFVLRVPAGASATITRGGQPIALSELELQPSGERRLMIAAGHLAEVKMGEFALFVRPLVEVPEPALRAPWIDLRALRWVGAALAFHLALFAMLLASPPDASALTLDSDRDARRYLAVSLEGLETPPPPPAPAGGGAQGGDGAPASASGAGGSIATPQVAGGRGRADGAARPRPRPLTAESVSTLGTIAAFQRAFATGETASDSPYALGSEALREGPGGPGALAQDAGGLGTRFGGLDMGGSGRGTCTGARCGEGIVASEGLRTEGGVGDGVTLASRRTPRGPQLRPSPDVTVLGGLSRDQIRRTVRNHISEIRFCYEQSLVSRPDLEGRVAVRFVVSSTGAVQAATVSSATPGTERVAGCMSQAVGRWTFPQSEGATAVTYPFQLTSQ